MVQGGKLKGNGRMKLKSSNMALIRHLSMCMPLLRSCCGDELDFSATTISSLRD